MKKSDRYLKIVEWSEEDKCYVGRAPGLAFGGVHGKDEKKVYEELCDVVDEWIKIYEEEGTPLPPATAGKRYSGKFNLRVGEELHERLAIESMKVSESLNTFNQVSERLEDFFRSSITCRNASLTASDVGNCLATSGSSTTTFVPSANFFAYLPRTPLEKLYSSFISSV